MINGEWISRRSYTQGLFKNLKKSDDDLISRQAAIEALKRAEALTRAFGYHNVIETIRDVPTAEPKKGKWERHYSRPNVYADLFWYCSECGYKNDENYAPVYHHYCPNCGARLTEV